MNQERPQQARADAFFKRAAELANTGNWDYAIECYVQGLGLDPDNVDRGHKPFRDVALRRAAAGGKGGGLREQIKRRGGKTPVESMLNAEYLLAKAPGNLAHMLHMLKSAQEANLLAVVDWIAQIILENQITSPKRNKKILLTLVDALGSARQFGLAVRAAQMALELDPDDAVAHGKLGDMQAERTIQAGKYDTEGELTRAVVDIERQKELWQEDALAQSDEHMVKQVERTRREYEAGPTVQGKVHGYVEALLKFEDEEYENRAIDVLTEAYEATGSYQYKARIGDIRIRQGGRKCRQLLDAGETEAAQQQEAKQYQLELDEYTERMANYPTDLGVKFELGWRKLRAGQVDEAIGLLQKVLQDLGRRVRASVHLGRAFMQKGWQREAADTFARALDWDVSEDRRKELLYELGIAQAALGRLEDAESSFSQVVQTDFTYRDAADRLDAVRQKLREGRQGG